MERVLVSACLIGELVRHHGGHAQSGHPTLARWVDEGRVVSVCPEMLGGLPAPRPPAEIVPGTSRVVTREGVDVTAEFTRGAEVVAGVAESNRIRIAVLKANSPSCGSNIIYDGTFSGTKIPGDGLTTARLRALGIEVFSEEQIDAAAEYLASLER